MMPIVNGLADEYRGDVYVEMVDIENFANRGLVGQYAATAIPLIVIFNDQGEISGKFYGYIGEQALRRAMIIALDESSGNF